MYGIPREGKGRESFGNVSSEKWYVWLHHLPLKGESRESDFWVTENASKAGSVIDWPIFFPWGGIVNRDSWMSVVNTIRSNEGAHASVKFGLLNFENRRAFGIFGVVFFW